MNLPNRLTILRLALTILLAAVLQSGWKFACTLGLLLFAVASITDYADGAIARSRGLITDFGTLMDPLVDKILTASALICLAALDYDGKPAIAAWVAIVIIGREFLITGLRQLAAAANITTRLPGQRGSRAARPQNRCRLPQKCRTSNEIPLALLSPNLMLIIMQHILTYLL